MKNRGDGLVAAFDSASQAVSCAVAMQQRFERRNRKREEQLLIKVGLSVGDTTATDGDYFGMPVIEAARLCDRAHGGQILAKEIVAHLAGGRHDHAFKAIGGLELKGLPEPLRCGRGRLGATRRGRATPCRCRPASKRCRRAGSWDGPPSACA